MTDTFPMLRGARGATTLTKDSIKAQEAALVPLLQQLLEQNEIATEDLATVFFTLTPDITSISPAKTARLHLEWGLVPMMCTQEPLIEGLPNLCIRVLLQFYTHKSQSEIQHVYLNGASVLRPDLRSE